jgi:hypothetical protein
MKLLKNNLRKSHARHARPQGEAGGCELCGYKGIKHAKISIHHRDS